ncbi:hypothetical protein DFP73DRAFT_210720 [Morchella snyderi]|nr:hypothetical protein DFP73DRAFT_210720 [Morchella snyderi]
MAASHHRNPSLASTKNCDDEDSLLKALHDLYNFPMPSERTRGLPYVKKLRKLLKLGPERIHNALDALETMSKGPRKIWKGKGRTDKLLREFEKILDLEFELFMSIEFSSDRDTSILPLLNWDINQATIIKRQDRHARPLSPAENLSQYREKLILSEDESGEGSITDIDSDHSFYSCSETPLPLDRVQKIPKLDVGSSSASSSNPTGRGSFGEIFQKPQRMEILYPGSQVFRGASYLRSSGLGGTSRHRPQLLKQTPGTPGAHRNFNTSGDSNKIGQDYSPSRNPNASADRARVGRASANNKPRTRTPRLSALEAEQIRNGDLDSEIRNIDDVKIDPVALNNGLSMDAKQGEPSLVRHLENSGSEYTVISTNGKDDDEGEIAFRKFAVEFFEEDYVSYSDSPLLSSAAPPNREGGDLTFEEDEEKAVDEVSGFPVDDLCDNLGRATIDRQAEGEGTRGEGVPFVVPGRDHNVSNDEDHDDDYGTIDVSFEDEVMSESIPCKPSYKKTFVSISCVLVRSFFPLGERVHVSNITLLAFIIIQYCFKMKAS